MSGAKHYRDAFVPYRAYTSVLWLKVGGVGLGVENMYAATVWSEIQRARGQRVVFPDEPEGSIRACIESGEKFRGAALRGALTHWSSDGAKRETFVENYPLPRYLIGPRLKEETDAVAWRRRYLERLDTALDKRAGLSFHQLRSSATVGTRGSSEADVWVKVFNAFKESGDLNSMLLYAEDGYAVRSAHEGWLPTRNESVEDILRRPKMAGDLTECFAGILLMMPQSALWLEDLAPYVIDGREVTQRNDGVKLYGMHKYAGFRYSGNYEAGRQPAEKFAPTEYVQDPWTKGQIAQYNAMPTLGWVHQPKVVRVVDESNSPLPQAERVQRLQEALQQLVETAFDGAAPVRLFYSLAEGAEGVLQKDVLAQAMSQVLPKLDLRDHRASYDVPTLLGDLGVGTSLVAVGMACLAGWEQGGNALVVDWRDPAQATLLGVKPAREDHRKAYVRRPYEMRNT